MSTLKKVSYIFDRKQKITAALLFVTILFGAFVELLGVTVILPFINTLINPEKILENDLASWAYTKGGFQSINDFIVCLALGVILVYILKNIYV